MVTVIIIASVFVHVQAANDRAAHSELQKRLEAIRKSGRPMTAADMARLYPDPAPERDAVRLLMPALTNLAIPDDPTNLYFFDLALLRSGPLNDATVADGRKLLDRNQAALDSVSWADMEGAWVGSGYSNGMLSVSEAPLSKMHNLERLLCTEAIIRAEEGRPIEALESLRHVALLAHALKNDMPLRFLVRAIFENDICVCVQRIMNRASLPEAQLEAVPRFLTVTNVGAIREMWRNDVTCMDLFVADQFQSLAQATLKKTSSLVSLPIRAYQARLIYRDQDFLNALDWHERCVAALDLPVSNAIPALRKLDEELLRIQTRHHVSFFDVFRKERFSFLSTSEPPICGRFMAELAIVARVRTTISATSIERWRLARAGEVPQTLDQLVPQFLPAVLEDPFDGRPLRYKKVPTGYVIYSIGQDLKDDGGIQAPPGTSEPSDITFTVSKEESVAPK
jgi:hypothetical protein